MTSAGQTVPAAIDSRHPSSSSRPIVGITTLTSFAMNRSPISSPSHHESGERNHAVHLALAGALPIVPELPRQAELGPSPRVEEEGVPSRPVVNELVDREGPPR